MIERIAAFWFATFTLFCVLGTFAGFPNMLEHQSPVDRGWVLPPMMRASLALSLVCTAIYAWVVERKR